MQPISSFNTVVKLTVNQRVQGLTSEQAEMSGLEPIIFLAKGAHVMITMNLWTDVGLCNGANGAVLNFMYARKLQPRAP